MSDITTPDTVYGPGKGHLHDIGIGGNPYPYGECTWYVWQFYHDTQQVNINGLMGNATDWVTSAHREQYTVDNSPVAGKTVSWSAAKYPPFGHLAVVSKVNGDGSFDVLEMNFTYFADENPDLAGKIDQRTVKNTDGIQGFITPHNVTISDNKTDNPFDALTAPFTSIGDAIKQAGLYLQAEAMTAQHKLISVGQVGIGTLLAGSGGVLAGLTLYGGGNPSAGLSMARTGFRKARKPVQQRTKAYRDAEAAWLSRKAREEMAENKRIYMARKPVHAFGLTDRKEIAADRRATRARIEAARTSTRGAEEIPF